MSRGGRRAVGVAGWSVGLQRDSGLRTDWCGRRVRAVGVDRGASCGHGRSILAVAIRDRRPEVGGEVEDELAIDHHVIVRLAQVSGKHFWSGQHGRAMILELWNHLPSPPASKSITLPTRTFTTPRKPWSFFLNFFWSKICTARMLSSLTRLVSSLSASYIPHLTPAALHAHIEAFIPVRIQCLLDYAGCFRLLAADGSDREGIRESCVESGQSPGAWIDLSMNVRKTSRLYSPSAAITANWY